MADVFDSAWLKFGWAIRHEQQLKEENDRFVRADLALQEKVTYLSLIHISEPTRPY